MSAFDIATRVGRMYTLLKNRGYVAKFVTIQEATETQDSTGANTQSWSDTAHAIVSCLVYQLPGRAGGGEVRLPDGTFLIGAYEILIPQSLADVTEKMRALIVDSGGGVQQTLDIMLVNLDPLGTTTTLTCQLLR